MAKRKKPKPNTRQQRAEHRRAYLRRTTALAEQLGVEDFPVLMSPEMYENLYGLRVRLVIDNADGAPSEQYKALRARHNEVLGAFEVALYPDGPLVPMRDFLTYGQTLYFFVTSDKQVDYKKRIIKSDCRPKVLQERLRHLITYLEEDEDGPYRRLLELMWYTALPFNSLDGQLYWLDYKYELRQEQFCQIFKLRTVRPECRKVRIDGIGRRVYRLGWAMPTSGPRWLSVRRSLIDKSDPAGSDPARSDPARSDPAGSDLPVFVQAHALHRLSERLDGTDPAQQQFYLYTSMQEPEVVENEHGQQLVAYYFKEYRVGYLVVDPVDDILVVRTFLFITMDSTPEGNALQTAIGLEAVDKKYLAIDRMSTFLCSDIGHDPTLQAHFVQAGCQDLLKLNRADHDAEPPLKIAQYIHSYLRIPHSPEPAIA